MIEGSEKPYKFSELVVGGEDILAKVVEILALKRRGNRNAGDSFFSLHEKQLGFFSGSCRKGCIIEKH